MPVPGSPFPFETPRHASQSDKLTRRFRRLTGFEWLIANPTFWHLTPLADERGILQGKAWMQLFSAGVAYPHPRMFHHQKSIQSNRHPPPRPRHRRILPGSRTVSSGHWRLSPQQSAFRPPPAAGNARALGFTLGPASSPKSCTATSCNMDLACRRLSNSPASAGAGVVRSSHTTTTPSYPCANSATPPRSGVLRSDAAHPAARGLVIPQELVGPLASWRGGKRQRCGRFSFRRTLTISNQFGHAISPSPRLDPALSFLFTTRLSCIFARGTGAPSREACAQKPKAFLRYRIDTAMRRCPTGKIPLAAYFQAVAPWAFAYPGYTTAPLHHRSHSRSFPIRQSPEAPSLFVLSE